MPLLFNNNQLTNYKRSYYALIMTQKRKLFTPQHPLTNHHPYQQNKKLDHPHGQSSIQIIDYSINL